jgi:predicted ATPase
MHISRIKLKNWRNFKGGEVSNLPEIAYVLGANAAGKSNFLDAIRFLRDVAKSRGGGLEEAIDKRGGVAKIRCLHARQDTEILIEVDIADENQKLIWRYELGFNVPPTGERHPLVTKEIVTRFDNSGNPILPLTLDRPTDIDKSDARFLRQTHIEQVNANSAFIELVDFFASITYVHLVPQLLKFSGEIGGSVLKDDPFGQEFMLKISKTPKATRQARLSRIERSLKSIVPHMEDLIFVQDEFSGKPHLEIRFKHHRPRGARQREDQFSDGTLRLISILWLLQENGNSPLLLEEPELSLNEEIVRQLPRVISRVKSQSRNRRQVLITTHSYALLDNAGIDRRGVIIVTPSDDGSSLRSPNVSEQDALDVGFTVAEAVLPNARKIDQLEFEL